MNDKELLDLSASLKVDADQIVINLNLLEVANKFSECYQIGSSVMDLMVDEDIDFTCYTDRPVDIDNCFEFAKELLKIPTVEKLKIKNYLNNPNYFQFKVYIEPYTFNGRDWKIAFSFQEKTEELVKSEVEFINWVKQRLTPETKLKILKLKVQNRKEGKKVPGAFVYNAFMGEK